MQEHTHEKTGTQGHTQIDTHTGTRIHMHTHGHTNTHTHTPTNVQWHTYKVGHIHGPTWAHTRAQTHAWGHGHGHTDTHTRDVKIQSCSYALQLKQFARICPAHNNNMLVMEIAANLDWIGIESCVWRMHHLISCTRSHNLAPKIIIIFVLQLRGASVPSPPGVARRHNCALRQSLRVSVCRRCPLRGAPATYARNCAGFQVMRRPQSIAQGLASLSRRSVDRDPCHPCYHGMSSSDSGERTACQKGRGCFHFFHHCEHIYI